MNGGETVADRHVHPATIPLRFLKEAPSTLIGLPAGYAYLSDQGLEQVLFFAAVIALAAAVFQWLAWRRFRYGISEYEIVIESGIFSRNRRSIPFQRIQDADIERGLLARLFGLAKLRIQTGGSAADEGVLDSVSISEAERLRAVIRARRLGASPETMAEEPTTDHETLFEMSLPQLLLAGLFNFSLVYIAGLFTLLQAFDRWLPFDIYDPGRWTGLVEDRLAERFSLGAIMAVAHLAILLGLLTGILRTVSRHFAFRLTWEGSGYRREAGLFTRSEVLIPMRRVQLVILETGFLRRQLGWYSLSLQMMGSGASAAEQGRQIVAPFARTDEVQKILSVQGEIGFARNASFEAVSPKHSLRRLFSHVLVPLILIIIAASLFPLALVGFAALPFLLWFSMVEWRYHQFLISDDILHIRRGLFRRHEWAIPLANIQSVRLSRSWLQRQLGLATLFADTTGAPMLDPAQIIDLEENGAREIAAQIFSGLTARSSPAAQVRHVLQRAPPPGFPVPLIGEFTNRATRSCSL